MMRPTGSVRFRRGWFGKLILQVEEAGREPLWIAGRIDVLPSVRWRDARLEDITKQEDGLDQLAAWYAA